MYLISVNKSQEFLLNVRRLFIYFFDDDVGVLSTTSYTNHGLSKQETSRHV